MNSEKILLCAHRGDQKNCPENTMPAFEAAAKFGVDMIETDIHMTVDGELVHLHDRNTLRTTGVDAIVNDLTLAEVQRLDASYGKAQFQGVVIPRVRQFLDMAAPTDIIINWELKDYPRNVGDEKAFECADKLIELVREYGVEDRSIFNSFSDRVLEHIYRKYGGEFVLLGQGIHKCSETIDKAETAQEEMYTWCCMYPEAPGLSATDARDSFDYCAKHSLLPCICCEDTMENYKKTLEYGCRMYTSNDIYEGDRILRALGLRG